MNWRVNPDGSVYNGNIPVIRANGFIECWVPWAEIEHAIKLWRKWREERF